jgi:hypothetical protein
MHKSRQPLAGFNLKEDNYLKPAPAVCYALHQPPEGGLSQAIVQVFEITSNKMLALSAIN